MRCDELRDRPLPRGRGSTLAENAGSRDGSGKRSAPEPLGDRQALTADGELVEQNKRCRTHRLRTGIDRTRGGPDLLVLRAARDSGAATLVGVLTLRSNAGSWWGVLRTFDRRQWRVSTRVFVAALLVTGLAGQTLPGIDWSRMVAISWWNYPTWVATSALLGLIAATFVRSGPEQPRGDGSTKAASGFLGFSSTAIMACPVCNPIAIPFLGTGGILAFMGPYRGWLALASVVLLVATLGLRLRALTRCPVPRGVPVARPS